MADWVEHPYEGRWRGSKILWRQCGREVRGRGGSDVEGHKCKVGIDKRGSKVEDK